MSGLASPCQGQKPCVLRAFGVVEATAATLPGLRKQPGPPGGRPTPANLLNHAEEQTVVALAAVLRAIHAGGLQDQAFTDWAIVGAPRFPGRVSFAASLKKYRRLGCLSVSPTIIPYLTLHSLSSLISLALKCHGPSMGVSGGWDNLSQALVMGLALRQEKEFPGVWVVVTGWDPEVVPESQDGAPQPICRAAALALLPESAGMSGSRLRLVPKTEAGPVEHPEPKLPDLVRFLTESATANRTCRWSCAGLAGASLELTVESPEPQVLPLARSA